MTERVNHYKTEFVIYLIDSRENLAYDCTRGWHNWLEYPVSRIYANLAYIASLNEKPQLTTRL